jgi:hypothetical protein
MRLSVTQNCSGLTSTAAASALAELSAARKGIKEDEASAGGRRPCGPLAATGQLLISTHTANGYVSGISPSSAGAARSSGSVARVSSMWITASNWSAARARK